MKNYKALKTANKVSVAKVKVVTVAKVDEVKYKDGDDIPDGAKVGDIKVQAVKEVSNEELQLTSKSYNANTGEELDDASQNITLDRVAKDISSVKAEIVSLQSKQSDLEELEKDLKAL